MVQVRAQPSRAVARVSGRELLAAHVALLSGTLGFALVAYAGRIGAFGDAMNMFKADAARYPSFVAFIWFWYSGANGRIGGFVTDGVFQRLAAYGGFGPETFPWWLLAGISLYAALATPLNLAAAWQRVVGGGVRWLALTVAAAWALWVAHPLLFDTSLLGQAVGEYFVAFYAFSLAVLALATARATQSRGWFLAAGLLYFHASTSHEQVLAAAPILFITLSVAIALQRRTALPVRELAGWCALSGAAAALVLYSPGQRQRGSIVALQSGSGWLDRLSVWLVESITRSYQFLFRWAPDAGAWTVTAHAALVATVLVLAIRRPADRPRFLIALGLFAASSASMAHLLVSNYAPDRTAIFPALLLAAGLACAASAVKWKPPIARYVAVATGLAIVLAGGANLRASRRAHAESVWLSSIRTDAYSRVIATYRKTGRSEYQLAGCPPSLDAPWGLSAYFSWSGAPEIDVRLEGRDALDRGSRAVLECLVPPLARRPDAGSSVMRVRTLLSLADGNRGLARYDYWVPPSFNFCDVGVTANPNAAGSPLYRDALQYVVGFTDHWDYTHARVRRTMVTREIVAASAGGTRVQTTLVTGADEAADAPLDTWPTSSDAIGMDSTFLRVVVDHPTAANLADYDQVVVSCRQ